MSAADVPFEAPADAESGAAAFPPAVASLPANRSGELRAESRRRVLAALRVSGPCPQARLGVATRLSGAAVSRLVGELVAEGTLVSERASAERPGRPATVVGLDGSAASVVTVSIGIDRLAARCVDYAGRVLGTATVRPRTRELDGPRLVGEVRALVERVRSGRLRHVSLGIQGVVEHGTASLVWSPVLPAADVALAAEVTAAFGVPATLENDCRAIARALRDGHRETLGDSFATVLFTQGVGLGIYLDGAELAGARSSALEFGHLRHRPGGARCRCGRAGCIEAYLADYAIVRAARGAPGSAAPAGRISARRMQAVARAAAAGNAAAAAAFEAAGTALGEGLRQLFTLLDPMPVALVGRDEATLAPMRAALLRALSDVPGSRALGAGDPASHAPLHRYDDPEPLEQHGLALRALDALDLGFATSDAAPPARLPPKRRPARRRASPSRTAPAA